MADTKLRYQRFYAEEGRFDVSSPPMCSPNTLAMFVWKTSMTEFGMETRRNSNQCKQNTFKIDKLSSFLLSLKDTMRKLSD
ncbi:hypothetical protein TNCT_616491 [Trichonephila clavata]|uniref:Uncharacterized protein n=1 Tax=Trichonephila clavata TaxID=2740835 RepID=A0A8X6FU60_TRICU|nr:hypothetical protein TNCT_616491 [Trichonephila clavata]